MGVLMIWTLKEWMCGGYEAVRLDGEKVFIYRKLSWEPADHPGSADSFEFRWHGMTAGRLTAGCAWKHELRLIFMLDDPAAINEQDLLDITAQLPDLGAGIDGAN